MTDNITIALAPLLTIPLWVLYHRIFSVCYHGNVASAIVKELVGAFCTGLFLSILLGNLFGSVLAFLLRLCLFLLAVLVAGFLIFLIRNRLNFLFYLREIIIPEIIFTVLVTLLVYRIFLAITRKMEELEKRRDTDFV